MVTQIVEYLHGYYILNAVVSAVFPLIRGIEPLCTCLFELSEDGTCTFDYRDIEIMMFLAFVIVIKNRKWQSAKEYISNLFMFSKCANFLLLVRQDLRWGFLYGLLCIILFIAFPEPSYSGPDNISYFRGSGLDDALIQNPKKIYLVEFFAVWSPECSRMSSAFARLSLRYGNDYFKFCKLDATKYEKVAEKYKIDCSVKSKNLPTLILFENGKEKMRRPVAQTGGKITPYIFNEENMIRDFNLNEIYAATKGKKDKKAVKADDSQAKKNE